jgi:hypothetical protein
LLDFEGEVLGVTGSVGKSLGDFDGIVDAFKLPSVDGVEDTK